MGFIGPESVTILALLSYAPSNKTLEDKSFARFFAALADQFTDGEFGVFNVLLENQARLIVKSFNFSFYIY